MHKQGLKNTQRFNINSNKDLQNQRLKNYTKHLTLIQIAQTCTEKLHIDSTLIQLGISMNKDWKITQIFNLNSNKDLHDVTHSRIDLERKKKE